MAQAQDKRRRREPLLAPDGSGLRPTYDTILILGPNGCGKTTVAEQLALQYVRWGGKAWAIDPNGAWEDVEGVKSLWPADGDEGVDDLLVDSEHWGPGLIIGDDVDRYARYASQTMRIYMTSNRHLKKDQIWIGRAAQGMPKDAFRTARAVLLFAGALMEPYARKYLSDMFPSEIVEAVPTQEFSYLLIVRQGARWSYERRRTQRRKLRTKADKS